jgi:hypothetical protein
VPSQKKVNFSLLTRFPLFFLSIFFLFEKIWKLPRKHIRFFNLFIFLIYSYFFYCNLHCKLRTDLHKKHTLQRQQVPNRLLYGNGQIKKLIQINKIKKWNKLCKCIFGTIMNPTNINRKARKIGFKHRENSYKLVKHGSNWLQISRVHFKP